MTARAQDRGYISPVCRLADQRYLDIHWQCRGPREVRLPGDPPTAKPVLVERCGCRCHKATDEEAGH